MRMRNLMCPQLRRDRLAKALRTRVSTSHLPRAVGNPRAEPASVVTTPLDMTFICRCSIRYDNRTVFSDRDSHRRIKSRR